MYLEGAFWNPAVIQGKMRRLGFASDAGFRFERGVEFDGCARAVERATQLIIEVCGGHAGPLTDATSKADLPRRDPVRVRTARVVRILGVAFSPIAWLMGVEWKECQTVGYLLGLKMVATELVA